MSTREEFWRAICRYAHMLYLLLVLVTVLAVLNVLAMLVGQQSEGAFVVSLMVFAILGVTAAGIAVVLWRCNQR